MDRQHIPEQGAYFDAASEPTPSDHEPTRGPGRPFLGIQFRCCRTYGRIYRDGEAMAYRGNCPRCAARVSIPIGPGGQGTRFFSAG